MFGTLPPELPHRIAFFLIPQFAMMGFSSAIEPLRSANRMSGRRLYSWHILSKDGAPVMASNGIPVVPEASIAEATTPGRFSTLVVCAGIDAHLYEDKAVFSWLRRLDRQGIDIGAISLGSYVLARAGLLDGYRCTIHWENLSGFMEAFPHLDVTPELFEVDRNRCTCSGGTAALDMMLYLIQRQHGNELATKVSEQCLIDRIRNPHDRQRLPLRARLGVHNPKLISAIELMEANLSEPLEQDALANYVGLSRRQLERLFRRHLGRAPAHYYLELRLERARNLLYQSELPIVDIALACGFVSASHFSKCYRQMYGKPPREERSASYRELVA